MIYKIRSCLSRRSSQSILCCFVALWSAWISVFGLRELSRATLSTGYFTLCLRTLWFNLKHTFRCANATDSSVFLLSSVVYDLNHNGTK